MTIYFNIRRHRRFFILQDDMGHEMIYRTERDAASAAVRLAQELKSRYIIDYVSPAAFGLDLA